jgi:DNA-binding NarL/FixJ family response regulator
VRVVREGYRRLLERAGDIAVVGEAGDADSACASFRELDPDFVVMDITLPGASGIEAMRRMLAVKHDTLVLMFSMHQEPIFAKRPLRLVDAQAPDQ